MSVLNNKVRETFAMDGVQTVFSVTNMRVVEGEHILAKIKDTTTAIVTTLVPDVDFTVEVVTENTIDVTVVDPQTSDFELTIFRSIPLLQESDYADYGSFPAETLEDDLDLGVLFDQQVSDGVDRAIKFDVTVDLGTVSVLMPDPLGDALIGWNSAGTALINNPASSPTNFTGLTDTPANYVGAASKTVAVKGDELGLEFVPSGALNFTELLDTPANFIGAGGKAVQVNAGATALEFVSSGAASPPEKVTETVSQAAHGLVVGDIVRWSGTAFVKAQADGEANAEVYGIVSAVADASNFTLQLGGKVSGLTGVTSGVIHYLDDSTAGAFTSTEPTAIGSISKPVLLGVSTTEAYFYNMRGVVVGVAPGSGIQDIWFQVDGDTGSTTPDTTNDTLIIAGGTGISTAISGDTLTITNDTPEVNQDLWDTITGDTGSTTANSTTDNLTIAGGTSITTSVSGDTLTIVNDDPNVDQSIWLTMIGDSGSTSANTTNDTFTIAGGTGISTSVAGDVLTITNDSPSASQNLFETVASDSGSAVADNSTDTLTITGGTGISTSVSGDTLTITNDSPAASVDLWDVITGDSGSTTANSPTDNLTIAGGTNATTAVSGDTLTINVDDSFILNTGDTGTGVYDFGGASSFEIPNGTSVTVNADGEIAMDTLLTGFSTGVIKFYNNEEQGVVGMPIAQFVSPNDGEVVTYNATADEFQLQSPSGSSIWQRTATNIHPLNAGDTLEADGGLDVSAGTFELANGTTVNWIDTDPTMAADSDDRLVTQKAVKTWVDNRPLILENITSPTALTANTDNWNPTGLSTTQFIRATNDGNNYTMSGIVAQEAGRMIYIANVHGSNWIKLTNENAGSTAANRFGFGGSGDLTLTAGAGCLIVYDGTSARWRAAALF